jgi:hypothetical protein
MTDQTLNEILYQAAAMYIGGDVSGLPFNEVVRRAAARYIAGEGGITDPLTAPALVDEFLFASTETGEIGELGWGFTNGTANLAGTPEANHPGIIARASSASSGAVASMWSGGGGTTVSMRYDQLDEMTWIIKPATAGADFDLRFGVLSDMTANPPTNGAYFEKLSADTNWFGVGRAAGVQTRTDTGVALSANWFRLTMRRISDRDTAFSIDGGAEVLVSSNTPLAANTMVFGCQIIPTTASARTVNIDFFSMLLNANTR